MRARSIVAACLAATWLATGAAAQSDNPVGEYRRLLADPFANPGYLFVDRGEALWHQKRGSKNASLEQCDLGLGPGVTEGAYARLPRYFADADRVMDLETRLMWCMVNLQGFDEATIKKTAFSKRGGQSDMEALVAYVAEKSSGMKFEIPLEHPKEKEAYALGEAVFYRRSSYFDFSCSTCHSQDGRRIRLQELGNMKRQQDAARAMTSWPTYRVSHETLRTMQHRMWDCFWQMRMPDLDYGSELSVALITWLTKNAEGGELAVPGIKR